MGRLRKPRRIGYDQTRVQAYAMESLWYTQGIDPYMPGDPNGAPRLSDGAGLGAGAAAPYGAASSLVSASGKLLGGLSLGPGAGSAGGVGGHGPIAMALANAAPGGGTFGAAGSQPHL